MESSFSLSNALHQLVLPYFVKNALELWFESENVPGYAAQIVIIHLMNKLWENWMSFNLNAAIIQSAQRLFPILNTSSIFQSVSIRIVKIKCKVFKRNNINKNLSMKEETSSFSKSKSYNIIYHLEVEINHPLLFLEYLIQWMKNVHKDIN